MKLETFETKRKRICRCIGMSSYIRDKALARALATNLKLKDIKAKGRPLEGPTRPCAVFGALIAAFYDFMALIRRPYLAGASEWERLGGLYKRGEPCKGIGFSTGNPRNSQEDTGCVKEAAWRRSVHPKRRTKLPKKLPTSIPGNVRKLPGIPACHFRNNSS